MFEGIGNPLFFVGVVEDNVDPRFEGRIKVRAFGFHGLRDEVKTTELPWAICAKGDYDANGPLPPLNSFVYGMFLDGRDAQHPLVLGLIPSQFAEKFDPVAQGWGVIPTKHGKELAKGNTPKDFGMAAQSRLARGENLKETYILEQEMNRVEDIKIANSDDVWDETAPAYKASYPFNRVIETSKHVIEIDDTPNAERIMIWHGKGSYIQIDAGGTTTHKSVSDKYDVNEGSQHVYVGGASHVHINNDATLYINGNMDTQVTGNYKMNIQKNAEFSVGGQLTINASDQLQLRSAEVKMESNVSNMSIFSAKAMKLQAQEALSQVSPEIKHTALDSYNIQAGIGGFNLYGLGDVTIYSNNIFGDAFGLTLASGGRRGIQFNALAGPFSASAPTAYMNLFSPIVTIDRVVSMANGAPPPPIGGVAEFIEGLKFAELGARVKAPEPAAKSSNIKQRVGSKGTAGATSSFRDV